MNINTVPILIPPNAKSPIVVSDNVDLDSIKIRDMVKVRLTDKHGNTERVWMIILDMKMDDTQHDVVLTGTILHDLVVFDFIPKHTVIDIYRSLVIDHVPFRSTNKTST